MATAAKRKTQTELGLGWTHRQASKNLHDNHQDGTPCDWCGRPMFKDRTRNWDYNPTSTNPNNGNCTQTTQNEQERNASNLVYPSAYPTDYSTEHATSNEATAATTT